MRLRSALLVIVLLTGGACNSGPTEAPVAADPSADEGAVLGGNDVRLTSILSLSNPIALATRTGDETALYIAQQTGRVVRVLNGEVTGTVLDISAQVQCCGEEGLLGISFAPNGGRLYVYHTDNSGDNDVVWFRMEGRRAVRSSRTLLLELPHPSQSNHNGGAIYLNPEDGFLYIATGDGGGGGDPYENAQDRGSLLGKILRIDPRRGDPYANPSGNPFVGRTGRDEILHYGLRNPWRFSIDEQSQMLWIGDVGQDVWEEIDRVPVGTVGANFGWDRMEGLHTYEGSEPSNHRRPIHEYSHARAGGCAITGGYVMRDPRLPGLDGVYVFSDYCDGLIRTLRRSDGRWVGGSLGISSSEVSSFGLGPNGRIFVLSLGGRVYRIDSA